MRTSPSMLPHVLFVDDEPAILSGLSRMLRPLRDEIDSEFVTSGSAALELLGHEHFDIVIADMRMPGMDGAALLEAVQQNHPHMIRIVLSGYSDFKSALRAVPVAHQFLAKPCEAMSLRGVIKRALGLHVLLLDGELQTLVAGMRDIPVLPKRFGEVSKLLADPLITSSEIAKAIARDVGLTAKLLKIVNSAFFGLPRRVASLEYAISCLGTSMLRPVILASAAADKLGPRATKLGYDLELNERHGFLSGQLAAQFFTDKNTREDALTAGLLQNVGELLLVADGSEGALRAMARAKEQNVSLAEAECEEGTVSHARVGAYLLGAWGLPYTIVEAVAHHHDPTQVAHETFDVCDAVHVGMLIADHFLSRHVTQAEKAQQYLHDRGMDEHFDRSMELARRAMSEPDSELH